MNRGPQSNFNRGGFTEKLNARFGNSVPEWLAELAAFADQHGLRGAAKRMTYSSATISQVLSGSYRGDVGRVEEAVRGALMGLTVDCPVLGSIGRDRCLDEQKQPFRATSAHRAALFHACRNGCPHSRLHSDHEGGRDAD